MNGLVTWVHEDCLDPRLVTAPALFVFDEEAWREAELSLQRAVFVYECLLDMPVEIHRGDVVTAVLQFAAAHQAHTVVTVDSVSPRLQQQVMELRKHLSVRLLQPEPFVDVKTPLDLRRFSRYWQMVETRALEP